VTEFQPFQNLMGLETEYAVRYHPSNPEAGELRPSDKELYDRLVIALNEVVPVVNAHTAEPTSFFATGGAIKFERFWQACNTGLVEGATPECRSPRDLLTWQRAQDQLFSQAAAKAGEPAGDFMLIKNNRDSQGNSYGSHENYDTVFATGVCLWLWRACLAFMYPVVVLGWAVMITFVVLVLLILWTLASVTYGVICLLISDPDKRPPKSAFIGGMAAENGDEEAPYPTWFEPLIHGLLAIAFFPSILTLGLIFRLCAFRKVRKRATAFFISRIVFSGAGWLDEAGSFYLSQKVGVCNCVIGLGLWHSRPILNLGNIAEGYLMGILSLRRLRSLCQSRQRLQVSYADSNLCEESEYLRLATTRLVLDAIEAGFCLNPPKISRPVRALQRLNRLGLPEKIAYQTGTALSAGDVQRWYLNQVQQYAQRFAMPSAEVDDILARWKYALDRLADEPNSLVGHVDWITKRFLLQRAGKDLPINSRRMIDMKYHEVSPHGYYFLLAQTGIVEKLVDDDALERAMRTPPPTRAAIRGRYIREFAGTPVHLKIDWDFVTIGRGKEARTVLLSKET
jgi:Pup amidohydrolase